MVSCRAKKKLDDRACMYCGKEFRYPYLFLRHKKTKCWIDGESTMSLQQDKVESTLDNVESTLGNVESTSSHSRDNIESTLDLSRVESTFEKNTVLIRLFLV